MSQTHPSLDAANALQLSVSISISSSSSAPAPAQLQLPLACPAPAQHLRRPPPRSPPPLAWLVFGAGADALTHDGIPPPSLFCFIFSSFFSSSLLLFFFVSAARCPLLARLSSARPLTVSGLHCRRRRLYSSARFSDRHSFTSLQPALRSVLAPPPSAAPLCCWLCVCFARRARLSTAALAPCHGRVDAPAAPRAQPGPLRRHARRHDVRRARRLRHQGLGRGHRARLDRARRQNVRRGACCSLLPAALG